MSLYACVNRRKVFSQFNAPIDDIGKYHGPIAVNRACRQLDESVHVWKSRTVADWKLVQKQYQVRIVGVRSCTYLTEIVLHFQFCASFEEFFERTYENFSGLTAVYVVDRRNKSTKRILNC